MVDIKEVIGSKLAVWQEAAGLNGQQVANQLNSVTGGKWTRQSVRAAVSGRRDWAITDLLALSKVMGTPLSQLLSSDELVRVGAWEATPLDLQKRTAGASAHIEAGKAHFRDLVTLAQIRREVTHRYVELLSTIRYEYSVHPELEQHVADHRAELIKRHRPTLEAVARDDASHACLLAGLTPAGADFERRVEEDTKRSLMTIPGVMAAEHALLAMREGTWASKVDEWEEL